MNHRLEARIEARPGEFVGAAQSEIRDNEGATPKKKLTHVMFVCEICQRETTPWPVDDALSLAEKFDTHPCKPKEHWPERPGPSPRRNPLEVRQEREAMGRKFLEEEEGR